MADKTLKAQPPEPGTQRGIQEEKKSTLVGVSKPVIRTLEVLPVAKVDAKSSGKNSEKDTRKVDNQESSKIDESVVKTELKVGTPIEKSCTSSGSKKVKVETKSVIASKGKSATLASKGRKEKKASDLVKLAPNLANKKACIKTDKQTVTSKPQREPDVKPEGKCAINVRKGAATAADKVGSKTKNGQGKAKTGKKDAEEKKVITWRISCDDDDDDSSESDFDNEEQRFVEEIPVTVRDGKGQKEGRKGSTVPPCTKTDDFEELVESSDAEDVFEEVIFSDEEDTPTDLGKARTKQVKDSSKASSRHQKTSAPQGTKVAIEKSSAKPPTVKKPTPGAQQQKNVDRESVKGKGTFVKKPVKEDAHESGKSKIASKSVPVKKIMNKEPRPTNETNPKKVGEKSNLAISNRKPSNGSTSETEATKVKPLESSNVTALKQKPAEGLRNSKGEGKELDSNEKAMPKAASKQLHLKNAALPAKVENSSQNTNKENKQGATEKQTVVSIDSSKKDILISAGNIGIGTMLANYTQEVSPKVLGQSSEVNPAGQDYIDPAVKLVTSEQSDDVHLNPTSPREPKPGNNSFRKGKYKSPDTSPRDMAGSKVIGPEKKPVRDPMAAKQPPVIMDIVEMFKQATSGTSPDVKMEVLGKIKDRVASVKGPVKKLVKNVPKKVSGTLLAKGSKGKAKERVGSGGKSRGRGGSGGSRGGEGSKVSKKTKKSSVRTKSKKKMKDINYSLVPESEQNTTAFITGQGWSIKTSRNENDDVYIQEGNQDDSSDEDVGNLGEVQLSPHNSLKLDELVVLRSISLEEKKNLVNILSPLEMNAPFFIPDTMGTIKEFADSLKSTSSSEMSAAKSVSRDSHSSSQAQDNVAVDGDAGSGERSETRAEPDQTVLDQAKEGDVKNSPPVPDVRVRKSSTHSQMGDDLNNPEQDSQSLGLSGELSNYETNPDLLKVFRIKDHYETQSSQGSRRTSMTSMTSDEEQVREHLSLILNKPDSGSDANEEASPGQRSQLKTNVLKKKPPLPKLLQQHQIQSSKRSSPRRASEPNLPPADADSASSPATPVMKPAQRREENKSQVSTIKNSLPDKKFSPPTSSVKKRRGKSLGDAQSEPSLLIDDSPSPGRPGIPTKSPIFEVDGHQDSADDDFVEEEEPLTRHVQTLTEKTLQEFKTIAQSLDSTTTSVIHTRPPSSVCGQSIHTARSSVRSMSPSAGDVINVQGGDQEEREFLNQSIALSETSSEVFRDFNDTGEVSHKHQIIQYKISCSASYIQCYDTPKNTLTGHRHAQQY